MLLCCMGVVRAGRIAAPVRSREGLLLRELLFVARADFNKVLVSLFLTLLLLSRGLPRSLSALS